MQMLARALRLPINPGRTFFLWGPWQTGKSTLLATTYPGAQRIDLLSSREFARLSVDPGLLREELEASGESAIGRQR